MLLVTSDQRRHTSSRILGIFGGELDALEVAPLLVLELLLLSPERLLDRPRPDLLPPPRPRPLPPPLGPLREELFEDISILECRSTAFTVYLVCSFDCVSWCTLLLRYFEARGKMFRMVTIVIDAISRLFWFDSFLPITSLNVPPNAPAEPS